MTTALRRLRRDESAASVVADMIVTPIFFILFFGMIMFMFYLRSQAFVYEAVYLGLTAAQGAAVGLDPVDAGEVGVNAIKHFLDTTDVVTLRDAQVTVSKVGTLWKITSYVYGGWEPGPLLNMSREITAEICLRAKDELNTLAVDTC